MQTKHIGLAVFCQVEWLQKAEGGTWANPESYPRIIPPNHTPESYPPKISNLMMIVVVVVVVAVALAVAVAVAVLAVVVVVVVVVAAVVAALAVGSAGGGCEARSETKGRRKVAARGIRFEGL